METEEFLASLLLMIFAIVLFPYIQNEINAIDTSGWNFTGYETVSNLLPAIPYIFLMAAIIIPVYFIIQRGRE